MTKKEIQGSGKEINPTLLEKEKMDNAFTKMMLGQKRIKEAYCSYETARLLKEKGFDEKVFTYYEDEVLKYGFWFEWNRSPLGHIAAPTHQMACAWLREVHNKHCDIGYDIDLKWFFQIIDLKETVGYDYPETKYYHTKNETGFNSYEEAIEAALKYTLENLL